MITTISRHEKYFGSENQIKITNEIFLQLWKTQFCQKNPKKFVNMSQIDNLSLWIENTCLRTSFKTSSFSRKNMSLKNIFQIFIFLWLPQSKSGTPKNWKSWLPQSGLATPKNWKNGTPNKQHYRFGMVENCWKVDCAQSVVCLLGIFPRSKFGLIVEIEDILENSLRDHRCSLWDQWRFKILVWASKPLYCPAQALFRALMGFYRCTDGEGSIEIVSNPGTSTD